MSAPYLGIDILVSEHATTTLKGKAVGKNIPTVAKLTQGEVVTLANKALQSLCERGTNVLLEGRSQTVNYIRSPHRFELVLANPQVIGMRRLAQILMGKALEILGADGTDAQGALRAALEKLADDSGIVTLRVLRDADSNTTAAIIRAFGNNPAFREVSMRIINIS